MGNRPSDEELLTGFVGGREDMFGQLVRRYEKCLYDFICRVSGEVDAEDVFQETFVRVFRHARTFEAKGSFRSWVFSIAANVCRSHVARRRPETDDIDAAGSEATSGAPSPPVAAQSKEVEGRVAEAVAALPTDQREVLVLRVYHDLSYPEIAQALDRPLGTVKSQMRYALEKLRGPLRTLAQA